jgi:outer membrane biosynthesis protein TonB
MHDMRFLAKTYQEHSERPHDSPSPIALQGAAVDPRVLLLPTVQPRLERWKIAMLSMMILLGLSASAIAVRLIMQPASAPSAQNYKSVEPQPEAVEPAPVANHSGLETPILESVDSEGYQLTSSPESSRANPQVHQAIAPPTPGATKNKSALRKNAGKSASSATKAADTCDEVACLVGAGGACCELLPTSGLTAGAQEDISERPYRLSRTQVMGPMQSISGRVRTCADDHAFEGVALVKIVIAPEGSVDKIDVDQGSEGFQSCLSKQVQTLHFPSLSQPFTVSYPYTLR